MTGRLPWALSLALMGTSCSVVYDADEFEICAELPDFPAPVCPGTVFGCLSGCGGDGECQGRCYDFNGDGLYEEQELDCYECVLYEFYECLADAGCAREVELAVCCSQTLCGPLGCAELDNPCEEENTVLGTCFSALPDPNVCNGASNGCFAP